MAKVTADEETRILALIDRGMTRNAIAREVGRSAGTITAIANKHERSFDRSATKIATAALAADNDARIEVMIARWQARHDHEHDRLDALDRGEQYRLVAVSAGVVIDRMVTTAPEENRQRILTAAAVAADKVKVLTGMRSNRGEGKSLLEDLVDTLAEREST